ncbi:MAG: hypothetical protein VX474_02710 [Pseudomonadota bacterium]|nr:hypothetical protein [Pseudomonadota bacterium]MEE2748859.1 hypothetical protein [Pseudomonadota bacterium]
MVFEYMKKAWVGSYVYKGRKMIAEGPTIGAAAHALGQMLNEAMGITE